MILDVLSSYLFNLLPDDWIDVIRKSNFRFKYASSDGVCVRVRLRLRANVNSGRPTKYTCVQCAIVLVCILWSACVLVDSRLH